LKIIADRHLGVGERILCFSVTSEDPHAHTEAIAFSESILPVTKANYRQIIIVAQLEMNWGGEMKAH
jgi:hypothetical protein